MANYALTDKLQQRVIMSDNIDNINENNVLQLIKPEQQALSIVPEFAITLNEAKQRIKMLKDFVSEIMVQDVDYGIIPNCNKPSLFKSGAEKLTDIFGLSKKIEITNRIENWNEGIFHYEVKAILISKRTGLVEAEGIGCANTKEKKYKSQDAFNIINTILKMAKKRALIDAVLSATRSSDIFTQDIEDSDIIEVSSGVIHQKNNCNQNSQASNNNSFQNTDSSTSQSPKAATKSQLNKIQSLVSEKSIAINKIKSIIHQRYNVTESKQLSVKQADDFIKYLLKL